jgi:hypothetical protein
MFGRRRPPRPDPALLGRVSDAAEVDLGTYPEDALAVVGAYLARGSLDHRLDGASSFRRLDGNARKAAMQAALDWLIADGTLNLPADVALESVVADGLDGKLPVMGPMANLCNLSFWFHRHGFQSGMVVSMTTTEGLQGVQMPYGAGAPGLETCLALPPLDGGQVSVLLVERSDNQASTRSYALRTVRQEFTRMAAFLFADVITPGEALRAEADERFRFGQRSLQVENEFVRTEGEDVAVGRVVVHAQKSKAKEPRYIKVSSSDLINLMTERFVSAAARTQ